ncbi:MAG: ABC transporter ATP-binding protein [Candidatus Eiseniibacteriota bacterium]|jgi:lipoprotein-releasing system ATP-binding protein
MGGAAADAAAAPASAPIIEVSDLAKSFDTPRRRLCVLDGVDLAVARGECVAVIGASGSGKSTLLHLMGALDRPDRGRVLIDGRDLGTLGETELALYRNRTLGFVFQFHHLLGEFSAVENAMMPALISGERPPAARARAMELLAMVGLADRAEHRPGELSGGEQQRVAVARALVNEPDLVLADEPSGNLDPSASEELHALLDRLRDELGQTLVIVTHERELARRADRVLQLARGRLSPVVDGGGVRPEAPGLHGPSGSLDAGGTPRTRAR